VALYGCFSSGHIVLFLIEPIVSWIGGVNTFHDAAHFALSTNPLVNSVVANCYFEFSTPLDWYIQHNIGHHGSTNEPGEDPDLYHGAGIYRSHDSIRWHPVHRWAWAMRWFVWSVGTHVGILYVSPLKMLCTGMYNRCVPLHYEHVSHQDRVWWFTSKLLCLALYGGVPLYHFGFPSGLVVFIMSRGLHSLLFMVHSQVSHLQTSCMIGSTDWYTHQVMTTTNHGCDSWIETLLSGGLNHQIEHHLFPSVNHCHHHTLRVIIRDTCRDHNIEYKEFDRHIDALRAHVRYIDSLSFSA
jgi:delta11-fatty-acid desaturase